MPENGWDTYQKMVMSKLGTLEERALAIDEQLVLLRIDVAQLKIKAGLWGATAGLIPALITSVVLYTGAH